MMKFRHVFMDGADDGTGDGAGGSGGEGDGGSDGGGNILDGGLDGNGGNIEFGSEGYKYAGKYDTPQALESGYKESVSMHTTKMQEMQDKLGAFVGAPEGDYEFPEDAAKFNDGVMTELQTWGKENGLSQDAMVDLVSKVHGADAKNMESIKASEMEKLGKDGALRITNANDKWRARFGGESMEMMNNMATSAEAVIFFESVLASGSDQIVNPDGSGGMSPTIISEAELDAAMFAKDSAGMLKMQTSPEYKKEVEKMTELFNKQRGK